MGPPIAARERALRRGPCSKNRNHTSGHWATVLAVLRMTLLACFGLKPFHSLLEPVDNVVNRKRPDQRYKGDDGQGTDDGMREVHFQGSPASLPSPATTRSQSPNIR